MWKEKIYIGIIVILLIVMIVLVVLTQEERKNLVSSSECSKVKGEYAAEAGYDSPNIVNLCGTDGKGVCTFTVSNLQNAVDICNTNPDKCERFVYNEQTKSISFVSDIPSFRVNPNSTIYIRQGGAIQDIG